jgi:hypothetical protein
MNQEEIETTLLDWLNRASVDSRTGLSPDAKVALRMDRITTIGHLTPGQSEPDSGMDVWSGTATLYFPPTRETWDDPNDLGLEISQVLCRLEDSLEEDPMVGDSGLRVEWRGTDGSAPTERQSVYPGYPWAVEVFLTASHI